MTDDIAEGILTQGESRRLHLPHEIGTPFPVLRRESKARDPFPRRSNLLHHGKIPHQPLFADHRIAPFPVLLSLYCRHLMTIFQVHQSTPHAHGICWTHPSIYVIILP